MNHFNKQSNTKYMRTNSFKILFLVLFLFAGYTYGQNANTTPPSSSQAKSGFVNASDFGFSPNASGMENTKALQSAVDQTGTIVVSQPGTYKIAGTVYIGSNTTLKFGNNIFLKKVSEQGPFTHVFLNKGALTKTYDQNISIEGLYIIVNGVDKAMTEVYGLRGQIAFFYIKDLRIDRFRCLDLATNQFCIHVCTFEDIIINDVIIKGNKDGIHLGRGKRFTISNCVFQTYDDAIALNGHDYATSNPELGWIEDGVIENCHDLPDARKPAAYFCRMLSGAWIDWKPGMMVHHSDAVVSNGKVYRVQAKPDGTMYKSMTQPTFEKGNMVLDGINWGMVQTDSTYTAGVRNVIIRNVFLEKPRTGVSIHFDNGSYSRSYYPGAITPKQEQFTFDNIRVLYDNPTDIISVGTPIDVITITNSSFRNNRINFHGDKSLPDYLKTKVNIVGCVFNQKGKMQLINNNVANKEILLKTSSSIEVNDDFSAYVTPGNGTITVESDLTGLKK
jgi:hypothetical protein